MQTPVNPFKQALREQRAQIGLWLGLGGATATEICAGAGVDWLLIACIRLAVVIHRARDARGLPPVTLQREGRGFTVTTAPGWLQKLPLTAAALEEERRQWQGLGRALYIRALSLRAPTS